MIILRPGSYYSTFRLLCGQLSDAGHAFAGSVPCLVEDIPGEISGLGAYYFKYNYLNTSYKSFFLDSMCYKPFPDFTDRFFTNFNPDFSAGKFGYFI